MATRLLLVRHGATTLSAEDRFAGATDIPLSDEGRSQAAALAERLRDDPIEAIYCSPMRRTLETASIIADPHRLTPVSRPALREIDHGHWEGLTRQEVESRFKDEYARWEEDPFSSAPSGGECGVDVMARALPVIRAIVEAHHGQQVVVVSHKATIRLDHQQPARVRCARVSRPARPGPGLPERARLQGPGSRAPDALQRRIALRRLPALAARQPVQVVGSEIAARGRRLSLGVLAFIVCGIVCSAQAPRSRGPTGRHRPDPDDRRARRSPRSPTIDLARSSSPRRTAEPVFKRAYGLADLEFSTMLEPDMLMRIGSVTKQFTAGVILRLVELGKLRVTDTVSTYLPDYPETGRTITIEHLLTHTSGVPNFTALPEYVPGTGATAFGRCAPGDVQGSPARLPAGHALLVQQFGLCPSRRDHREGHAAAVRGSPARVHPRANRRTRDTHYDSFERIFPRRAHGYERDEGRLPERAVSRHVAAVRRRRTGLDRRRPAHVGHRADARAASSSPSHSRK